MNPKPLFIPLKSEHFEAFRNGSKRHELRKYGPRWNERTCEVGRYVDLSKGYGLKHRLGGRILSFKRQHGRTFGSTYRADILAIYGTLDIEIACIEIEVRIEFQIVPKLEGEPTFEDDDEKIALSHSDASSQDRDNYIARQKPKNFELWFLFNPLLPFQEIHPTIYGEGIEEINKYCKGPERQLRGRAVKYRLIPIEDPDGPKD